MKLSGLLYFGNSLINLNNLYDIFLYVNLLFVIELYNNRLGYLVLDMVQIGYGDVLSLAQTIGIVGTLILTLYFSKRQIQSLSIDVETKVLDDLG